MYIDIYAKITQIKYTVLKYPYSVDKYSRGSIVAVKKKLDWLTGSTVKEKDSFSPSSQHLYIDLKLDLKQSRSYTIDKNEIQSYIRHRSLYVYRSGYHRSKMFSYRNNA